MTLRERLGIGFRLFLDRVTLTDPEPTGFTYA